MMKASIKIIFLIIAVLVNYQLVTAQESAIPAGDTQTWNEIEFSVPVREKIHLIINSQLRIGYDLTRLYSERASIGLQFQAKKWLKITPTYLFGHINNAYDSPDIENRLLVDVEIEKPIKGITITSRSRYEHRIRSEVIQDNYRQRLELAREVSINGFEIKLFINNEVFYDLRETDWFRNRMMIGFDRKLNKQITMQWYYQKQNDGTVRPSNLHVLGMAVKFAF